MVAPGESERIQPGTILILLGICIAVLGLLLLVYQVMTCESRCGDSVDEEEESCICILGPFVLMIVVGTIIAVIGFVIRNRHRKGTPSKPVRDAD